MTRRDALRGAGFLGLVFVVAFAGVWAGQAFHRRPVATGGETEIASDLVAGAPFPDAAVLASDGTSRGTAGLTRGGALVLFLRSDCPACGLTLDRWRGEIASGALRDVPVVGITTDPPDVAEAYREAKGIPFPIYTDPERTFATRHGVTVIPFVVAVAPGGEIRERQIGWREDADLDRLGRLVTE